MNVGIVNVEPVKLPYGEGDGQHLTENPLCCVTHAVCISRKVITVDYVSKYSHIKKPCKDQTGGMKRLKTGKHAKDV